MGQRNEEVLERVGGCWPTGERLDLYPEEKFLKMVVEGFIKQGYSTRVPGGREVYIQDVEIERLVVMVVKDQMFQGLY
jgi:hypothetical protein